MAAPQKIFKRVVIINVESSTWKTSFNGDELEIRFEVPFDSDTTPNEIIVQIFNLTETTIKRFTKNMNITVQAGYVGNYGVLSRAKVSSVRTYREGADRITEIKAIDGLTISNKSKTNKAQTFKPGTKAETIIKKIASDMLGITIGELRLPNNKVFKKGYVVSAGAPMNHLISIAKQSGATVHWKRGSLSIRSLNEKANYKLFLSEETGLIGAPEGFDEEGMKGIRFKSLLQHRAVPGVLVEFRSRTSNGQYRLNRGKHICSGSDFVTEGDVV